MRFLFILFFLFSSLITFAQPESAQKVTVDGISYYKHVVVSGNTIYGLQKEYGVSVEEIMKLNPELESGLKVGQEVLIPIVNTPEQKTVEYKVKKKETLYGLSRKFNLSIDELIRLNPSLHEGLKKGQVILIPESNVPDGIVVEETSEVEVVEEMTTPNPFVLDTVIVEGNAEEVIVTFEDSIVEHIVREGETMYSISKRFMVPISEIMKVNRLNSTNVHPNQKLVITLKRERVSNVAIKDVQKEYDPNSLDSLIFEEKEVYNIVIMLPFHLEHGKNYSKYVSNLSTQFYMGAKLAVDSLKELGLNAKIHVFDTQNDSSVIVSILNKPLFEEVDLIIGPLLKSEVGQVAFFCKENGVRMVCPVSINQSVLEDNRLVYSAVAPNITLESGMATYLSTKNKTDRIIVVKPTDEKSIPYYNAFVNTYKLSQTDLSPVLIEATMDNFNIHIQKKNISHIVVPTIDKMVAMKFVNSLNKSSFRAHPGNIQIYGMKEWVNYTEIKNVYKNKYNFHFASPSFLDYNSENVVELNKKYRITYNTDLPKMAIQGYDIFLYYSSYFLLDKQGLNLMMNDFKIQQVSSKDGFENAKVFIIKQDEFNLVKIQ